MTWKRKRRKARNRNSEKGKDSHEFGPHKHFLKLPVTECFASGSAVAWLVQVPRRTILILSKEIFLFFPLFRPSVYLPLSLSPSLSLCITRSIPRRSFARDVQPLNMRRIQGCALKSVFTHVDTGGLLMSLRGIKMHSHQREFSQDVRPWRLTDKIKEE